MFLFYYSVALITAGIALALGLVSIFTGLYKDGEKVDIVFGIMCLCVFTFFLAPPAGFIIVDKAPYPANILVKRVFNTSFTALFPWFILYYTKYNNRIIPRIVSVSAVIGYLVMFYTANDSTKPFWVMIGLVMLGINLIHGFYAGYRQFKNEQRVKAYWLFAALGIFACLYIITIVNQLGNNYFGSKLGAKIFFPINLYFLAFILIMGIRLRANAVEKYMLEKILRQRDTRWHSMLERMQLVVLELDTSGKICYINPYGVELLGYSSQKELLQINWFEKCLPVYEASAAKSAFIQFLKNKANIPFYKNDVHTKSNKWVRISWSNLLVYDDEGNIKGTLSLGSDITNEEKAIREVEELKTKLEKENLILKGEPLPGWISKDIIGQSSAIKYALQKAKQVATANASVMLEGETGVGKELFAELIYQLSLRHNKPFIKVNCGALPAELIEDELFGHEKGAFTGAQQPRKGRFELANGGTIFLDEIGELPLALQPKLLRVLQNGEFERVGGQETVRVDVRIIAATNRNLDKEVHMSRFREDLFYRLNVFPITIPALRNRKEDIPLLISFFIERKNRKHNKNIEQISKADMQRLCDYAWPGNIRELKNVIERSVISSETNELKLDWWRLPDHVNNGFQPEASNSLEDIEKEHIIKLLQECNWKISGENGAAEKLAMHPNTLRSRMKKLNITRPGNGG